VSVGGDEHDVFVVAVQMHRALYLMLSESPTSDVKEPYIYTYTHKCLYMYIYKDIYTQMCVYVYI